MVLNSHSFRCQSKDEKFFYKDTMFDFHGIKIELSKSLSTKESFKSTVTINNPTDQFVLVNPSEVFGFGATSKNKHVALSKRVIAVAPKYSRKFTIRFEGEDFRESVLWMDFTKLQITDKVEAVYELQGMSVFKENNKQTGPVKWTILDIDESTHGKIEYRINCNVEYRGNKFLGIFYNNIILSNNAGETFVNVGKRNGKFSYETGKPHERVNLIFTADAEKLGKKSEPVLKFNEVFKEYSLSTIEGFKINLRQGTLEDYNRQKPNDKEIEEID